MTNSKVILTAEQRDDLISCMWDGYKEIHGVRPRWIDFESMSDEQLETEYELFCKSYQESWEEDCRSDLACQKMFEETISKTIAIGAKDRQTALRWMIGAVDCCSSQDVELYLYNNGVLSCSMFKSYMQELEAVVTYIPWEDVA